MLWITLQLGVRNLMLHKLRSFLTMLGTILGVGSVIAMLAIGEGSKRKAVEQIRQLGATNVIIRSIKPAPENDSDTASSSATQQTSRVLEYGLKYRDFERLEATIPTVVRALPISQLRKDAQHGRRRIANARILGTTPLCPVVKNLRVHRGRFLTDTDLRNTANVCVLGAGAANRLFGYEDPLGKDLLLGAAAYRVVGVLGQQAGDVGHGGASNQDGYNNDIYIPLTAARRRFGELQLIVRAGSIEFERTQLSEITLTVTDEKLVSQTAAMARAILEKSHTRENDYEVQVPLELLRQAEQEKRIWHCPVGGWHRDHEHHAGDRDGTDARDRHSSRARRAPTRHHFPIPGRNDRVVLDRGAARHSRGSSHSHGGNGHFRDRDGLELVVDLSGVWHLGGDGHHVRHVSGAASGYDGSH